MSERKVLNKYYPPDFDPSKIPRMKLARNRQYTVRLMAPFNMRCKTCGEYIYKGKKFNARKEDVEGDSYLGIRIYRFYIKCTRCLQEISFKTDPKNTDYEIEAGATRNFMALKLAEEQAQREEDEEKEEEATNPMKLLEKRTQQSKQELELLESLEELKDLNRRQQTIDYDQMLQQYDNEAVRQRTIKEQEDLDEEYVKSVFSKKQLGGTVVEEEIVELNGNQSPTQKRLKIDSSENQSSELVANHERLDAKDSDRLDETFVKPATSGCGGTSWSSGSLISAPRPTLNSVVKKKAIFGVKTTSCDTVVKNTVASTSQNGSVVSDSIQDRGDTKAVEKKMKTATETEKSADKSEKKKTSGLSLLGSYSGSSDNESD